MCISITIKDSNQTKDIYLWKTLSSLFSLPTEYYINYVSDYSIRAIAVNLRKISQIQTI